MKRTLCSIILTLILTSALCQTREIRAVQQSLPLIKDSLQYIDALNRIAILYYEWNTDSLLIYAGKAMAMSGRRNYDKGKADALNNMGIFNDLSNNPSLAFRYYHDALSIYRDIGDSSNIVQLLMNIALILHDKDEEAKSLQYFHQAIHLGQSIRKDSIMSLVYSNYLSLYLDSVPSDSVQVYLGKARYIADKYHDQAADQELTQTEGLIDLKEGKTSIGVALLKESVQGALNIGADYLVLDILGDLGDYYLKDQPDTAAAYYSQALHISEDKKYNSYIKQFSKTLYDFYQARGNPTQASMYADEFFRLQEQEDKNHSISGVDYIDYAIATKELDAARANAENRRLIIFILSIFSISVAAIGLIIYQLYRLKQKHTHTLEALNRAVSERNNQLQQKHEFNNKLISLLAHDFRQPINTARSLAMLLKEDESMSREEMHELVESIEISSDAAIDIFENILQWIKKQLSGFSYEPVPLSLRDLMEEAMRPFLPAGDKQKIALINAVSETITIQADKELLQFINRNLIHNALKFSPEGSSITITAHASAREVIVCFRDEGKGINPRKLPMLFNAKKDLTYDNEKEKGAGVALMICKDFIDRMFGRIWAENGQPKGATFFYALPIIGK
jgi:signal transduction histidine kinase